MILEPVILDDRYIPLTYQYEVFRRHAKIIDLKPSIIYYAWYGRNAWNWTWVEIYAKHGFFTNIDECKEWIEGRRVQGSVWHITQLPALNLILKNKIQLWICSVNLTNWWNEDLFDRKEIIKCFKEGQFHTSILKEHIKCYVNSKLLSFQSNAVEYEKLKYKNKCLEWKAVSFGGGYALDWVNTKQINHNYKNLILFVNYARKLMK
jgi:hypothetical protein